MNATRKFLEKQRKARKVKMKVNRAFLNCPLLSELYQSHYLGYFPNDWSNVPITQLSA